jgi:hypothetical protein
VAILVAAAPLSSQTLAVRTADGWRTWWRAESAPAAWRAAHPALDSTIAWRRAARGLELAELTMRGDGEAWRIRVLLARVDPTQVTMRVVVPPKRVDGFAGRWTIEDAPRNALLALNAGQFTAGPWGWLLQEGTVRQPAGTGALTPGVVIANDGRVSIVPRDSLGGVRDALEGFQSYPTLLEGDGEIPPAPRTPGFGVNLTHRDSRLAFGVLRDGRVLIALTRFEGLGGVLGAAPFGFTTPEMAAILGGLGARRAALLDGGLSGQLLARDGRTVRRWRGMRGVAAGLVVTPRTTR